MASCVLFTSPAVTLGASTTMSWQTKISAELWKIITEKSDDDLIPIWLWLKDIDQSIITNVLISEEGIDPAVYEDEMRFEKEIVFEITRRVEEANGCEIAHNKGKDGMSLVDLAVSDEMDKYIIVRREIVMREYSALNDIFIVNNIGEKQRDVIYSSRSTPSLILEATKSEIFAYAKQEIVNDISLYVEMTFTPNFDPLLNQIGADSINGTKSNKFNYGSGYKGNNIVIGIIETLEPNTTNARFDPNAPQLNGIPNTRLVYYNDAGPSGGGLRDSITNNLIPIGISTHATVVTSIIVGQSDSASGLICEGVVPNATVYQTPFVTTADLLRAIDQLASKGVHVINISAGANTGAAYDQIDRDVDQKIASLHVNIVVAAGNHHQDNNPNNYVMSPGKALNAITVGNADTLAVSNGVLSIRNAPFGMDTTSSYAHDAYLPNKPDIAAPGTNIPVILYDANNVKRVYPFTGTSCAAPFVTGIVAQMMQTSSGSFLKVCQDVTKAILVLSATTDITTTNNPATSGNNYLRNKSGAGLVNAAGAINHINSAGGFFSAVLPSLSRTDGLICYYDQKIRLVLVFDKQNTNLISSQSDLDDFNIYIRDSSGNLITSSTSLYNNVEIVEFIPPATGTYVLQIVCAQLVDPNVLPRYTYTYKRINL